MFAVSSISFDCELRRMYAKVIEGLFLIRGRMVPLLVKAATQDVPSRVIIMGSIAGLGVTHVGEHGTIMVWIPHSLY